MTEFIFLDSKITADNDWSHKIKRHLLLGRKTMRNLDSRLKSKGSTLLTKVHIVKAMVFPVVMCGCESWAIMKASKNWSFWTVVLENILESPLTARRSNQSNFKEIYREYSLEELMLNLKLQSLTTWCEWCWERLRANGEVDSRGWDGSILYFLQ